MDLYFASAEQPQYLEVLRDAGVTRVAISYYEWIRRHDNDRLPKDLDILITPGISKKPSIDFEEFAKGFCEFTELYADRALIYDIDSAECPAKVRRSVREHLLNLPNSVIFPMENETLEELASQHERIGVNARESKARTPIELRRIGATLYGSNVLDLKKLRMGKFVATTTMAWLSPKRYGELWVFAGGRLQHYAADQIPRALRSHRGIIEAHGFEMIKLKGNDHDEMIALAIKSMQDAAESLSKRPRDREAPVASPEVGSLEDAANGDVSGEISPSSGALVPAGERTMTLLPVISMKEEVDGLRMASSPVSVRMCDTCNISGSCPEFHDGAKCSFDLPVEISTRAQWKAAAQVLLETQFGRAMFSHFADQVDGGTPSKTTGSEIDRFFKVLKDVKELEHIDPAGAPEGALSSAFKAAMEDGDGEPTQTAGEDEDDSFYEGDEEGVIDAEFVDEGLDGDDGSADDEIFTGKEDF